MDLESITRLTIMVSIIYAALTHIAQCNAGNIVHNVVANNIEQLCSVMLKSKNDVEVLQLARPA